MIRYGVAYYDEYMPYERLKKDMQMMKQAGINVIRIAESTWSSEEPSEGIFDFSHVTRVIEEAANYNIDVIVGTPTYAIPPWLAYMHPDIIAETENGSGKYGQRQNMDITNPHYQKYAERIIRKLMEATRDYKNVIGFQIDNETKHYHVAGKYVQQKFIEYLKEEFETIEKLNTVFGFAYWSNQIDSWEHIPDVTGTINGSFWAEFEKFRRIIVNQFLMWQRKIIDEYRREDQFVTQNFDFEWRNHSFGVQPDVNHFQASKAITLAGCDIYHESQDMLTGKEAAFCGAITRELKHNNYLVLETNAQGHVGWTPYDGQLRMQAYMHLANGANGVMYWHWHSIHNSFETYWRGILSHDLEENRIYREMKTIGEELNKIGSQIIDLKKDNRVAILVSNEALTALSKLPMFPLPEDVFYNDIVRSYADALYELNVEYDVVSVDNADISKYDMLIIPALYCANDDLLNKIDSYVKNGGHIVATFKTAYADEYLKVTSDRKPHILHECLGVYYQEFTIPRNVLLKPTETWIPWPIALLEEKDREAHTFMEFLIPDGAKILASYDHPYWGRYAAITENQYGKGSAYYVGCHVGIEYTIEMLYYMLKEAGIMTEDQKVRFPICIKNGINKDGKRIHYYFNFSNEVRMQKYTYENARELRTNNMVNKNESITLYPWEVFIFEETAPYILNDIM